MKVLDIGCGFSKRSGAIGIDRIVGSDADIITDLNCLPLPLQNDSMDAVYCMDVLEHLPDVIGTGWKIKMQSSASQPKIDIGDHCRFENRVVMITFGEGNIHFGNDCFLGWGNIISAHQRVDIGEGTAIAEYVSIRDHNHESEGGPIHASSMSVAPVTIGRRVWIGAKATIIAGVTIGDDAVIDANTVVTCDVSAGERVGGVPARPLNRKREDITH